LGVQDVAPASLKKPSAQSKQDDALKFGANFPARHDTHNDSDLKDPGAQTQSAMDFVFEACVTNDIGHALQSVLAFKEQLWCSYVLMGHCRQGQHCISAVFEHSWHLYKFGDEHFVLHSSQNIQLLDVLPVSYFPTGQVSATHSLMHNVFLVS